ncbi:Hypothetical protein BQ3484_467 [Cedratvirus A11]|uniref:BTB domain-containing protein n=1 Tax=Cedratvirus A11 TaxID=1903266 RepID=A0A1M7XV14_9VIRU|nr:Hypothetical protein BQ3484_467 [Cedratvirus A11]SHO33535.1 Hypothetical protein BQ3484_467 [Cedratvirus A11]
MQEPEFTLEVFDRGYVLPPSAVQRSKFLTSLFSGKYREEQHVELNLDQSLQPAFEIVYDYLLNQRLDHRSILSNRELFQDVFFLASYLNIPSLVITLASESQNFDEETLTSFMEFLEEPEVRNVLFRYHVSVHRYFAELPEWVQEEILQKQTAQNVKSGELYTLLLPPLIDEEIDRSNLRDLRARYPPGYSRTCQTAHRPRVIQAENITSRAFLVSDIGLEQFTVCPDAFPELRFNSRGELCCGKIASRDPRIKSYKPFSSPLGYTILVPGNFVGDYILTTDYTILPSGNSSSNIILVKSFI